jgi:hypothetical protein
MSAIKKPRGPWEGTVGITLGQEQARWESENERDGEYKIVGRIGRDKKRERERERERERKRKKKKKRRQGYRRPLNQSATPWAGAARRRG